MLTTLLIVIFISFMGIGLPDSVLGAAWPVMYPEFSLPMSLAGYITAAIAAGKVAFGVMSTRLIRKFGTGLLTAASMLMIALSLVGFANTRNFAWFFVFSVPLGIGVGTIDTVLNSFVAFHYSASQMSFLQCAYGLGVAGSPLIMSLALGEAGDWRRGYTIVAIVAFSVAAIAIASLPLWFKVQKKDTEKSESKGNVLSYRQLAKTPGAFLSAFCFFSCCALEWSAGSWSTTYFTSIKETEPDRAAGITMFFYLGLAGGRFLSGLFAEKLGRRGILKASFAVMAVSVIVFALPLPSMITVIALFMLGVGIGPVCPNLVHITPKAFGEENAQSVMGLQKTLTYLGIMFMPLIFGVLADIFSAVILPIYLVIMLFVYAYVLFAFLGGIKKREK